MRPSRISLQCPSEDSIALFLEGGLAGDQLAAMEQHLFACTPCARLAADVEISRGGTRSSPGARPNLPPGTRIARYVLQRPIGAGAMGCVYLAYDPTLDRTIALKLVDADTTDPALEARLLREAQAMARLARHPEVVSVYDAGRQDGQVFIAMELVDGGTLRTWMSERPRAWPEVVALFARAGRGLAHAHGAGIVHRDFKPDNVLVGRDGRVCVTDFGLARIDAITLAKRVGATDGATAHVSRSGTLVGTPAYMAPEQLAGRADARSDIFSFCVALYEALAGERPIQGTSPARGRIPRRLQRVLEKGLRRLPDERYPSMDLLLVDLQRASRRAPQRIAIAGAIALAVVAVVAGRGATRSFGRATSPEATPTAMPPQEKAPSPAAPEPAPPASSEARSTSLDESPRSTPPKAPPRATPRRERSAPPLVAPATPPAPPEERVAPLETILDRH